MSFLTTIVERTGDFLSSLAGSGDAAGAIRSAVLGALLAGVTCAVLGCFITLRRMALFGDMLGHAVLPGIAAGFIIAGHKSTTALLLGAMVAGLLAAWTTRVICSRSPIKEDAALGITLSTFYAVGVWLISWITGPSRPDLSAEASGLKRYLFGNPAVIQTLDLVFLGIAAAIVLLFVVLFFKELLACSFDPSFATTIGIPRRWVDAVLVLLLTLVIVVSIKILGVILVAALLVIPPATAYLLTERLRSMILCASVLGAASGFAGAYLDFVFDSGVGPTIVCVAFTFLVIAFLFAPRHGVVSRWCRHRQLALRTIRENLLATVYRIREREPDVGSELDLARLATERGEEPRATRALARKLHGSGWGEVVGSRLVLTTEGERRGRKVVRGHRLWELFLQREASLAPDHVHAGAEEVEHFLGDEAIAELERLLDYPDTDPHGRQIPATAAPDEEGAR
jgi:manganese/zinc/iron transport system permease protein